MQSGYTLQWTFVFLGGRKLKLTPYRHLEMLWELIYPLKKKKKKSYQKKQYRRLKQNWAIILCTYVHIPSVRELPLSTSVCYTYLLFSYRRETKDRHHSHYALHLEWFWIITTLSRLFATLYPRNTHLLKFSSITCTKIFFTLDSPFPIGITFQKCYLTPKDNRPLNMLENTSTFLGHIQVYERSCNWSKMRWKPNRGWILLLWSDCC